MLQTQRSGGNVYVIWTWTVLWRRRFIAFTLILLAASQTKHGDMGCQDIAVITAGTLFWDSLPTVEGAETAVCARENQRFGKEKGPAFDLKIQKMGNYPGRCFLMSWSVSRSWIIVSKVPLQLASTWVHKHTCFHCLDDSNLRPRFLLSEDGLENASIIICKVPSALRKQISTNNTFQRQHIVRQPKQYPALGNHAIPAPMRASNRVYFILI